MHCAEPVAQPAVLAWAYGRPVACLCEACVLTRSPAVPRRLQSHVHLRHTDYYEDPDVRYSYPSGPIARLVEAILRSRTP